METKEDDMQNMFLANACSPNEVFLQTLLVNIVAKEMKTIRALIDAGLQHSYLLRNTAVELGCHSNKSKALIYICYLEM